MSWNPKDIPIERPSSFDETGKKVFLYPAKVKGRYKNLRNIFYVCLLFVFLVVPWTTFNGEQTLLFDIIKKRFVFFGTAFSAHDGPLIFFPLILSTLGLAFVTSIWGRVWCGWACPQTVFLEAVFRRVEEWIEGSHLKRMREDKKPWSRQKVLRKTIKWLAFLIICSHMAHSFTAYFVGAKRLLWITMSSPIDSWALFVFVQVLTLILLFNFGWFREQFCIIMCPYGRIQSVLMGHQSLAVLYDEKRGEPRKQNKSSDHGDCVNCYKCVSVCPMGIDIRRGLQMECIACTACIDACDDIMEKVGKPKGLIRYTSISELSGGVRRVLNQRSATYLIFLSVIIGVFVFLLVGRSEVDVKLLRAIEAPYTVTGDTLINHFRLVLANQTGGPIQVNPPRIALGEIVSPGFPLELKAGEIKRMHFFIKFNLSELEPKASQKVEVLLDLVQEGKNLQVTKSVTILRP